MDSFNIFTTSDVLFNLHSIINNGLILGGQNSSNRHTVFCLLIPETKGIKILQRLTSLYHVVHNTCTVLRRNIKTWYFGLILILRFEEDWHSIRLDRMQSSFREHFQLIVFQNLWDWRLEKSYMRNHTFSSTTTKDLIATRSRLDQREISIGFYSWSTARR